MNIAAKHRRVVRLNSNFMRAKEASTHFRIAHSTLWNWVKTRPGFPQPIKAGARVTLFDIDAIEHFLRGEDLSSSE